MLSTHVQPHALRSPGSPEDADMSVLIGDAR